MNVARLLSAAVLTALLPLASAHPQPAAAAAWADGPALAQGRDHHGVFAVHAAGGTWLYVSGGTDYRQMFADVWRLRLGADGPVADWEPAGALPSARAGHSVAVGEHAVVLTGGQFMDGLRRIAEVYTARIRPDGSLDAWVAAPPLPRPAFHHPAVHHGGWVYVTGGQGETTAEAGVYGARLTPEGTLDEWVEMTPLPRPRSHHASFVHGGALYVLGGLDGHPAQGNALYVDAWRAEIQGDGTLGPWRRVSILPGAFATHSAAVHGGYVYLLGGVENDQRFVDTVWRARLGDDGLIGAWEAVLPGLPAARAHVHETPVVDGRIYSVGGSNRRVVSGALHVGTLRDGP
jgi:hypothetical protein